MMSARGQKKGLVRRGWDCLTQHGLRHTLYVLGMGEFRIDEDDILTYAESHFGRESRFRNDDAVFSAVHSAYQSWIRDNEDSLYTDLTCTPVFSVIVPVCSVPDEHLGECIDSVCEQSYGNWELILVDVRPPRESDRSILRDDQQNPKIHRIYRREDGNYARAVNEGIFAARGDYIAFMDCSDVLAPNALYEMARMLNDHPEYDFIYSDEDRLTEDGSRRYGPFFKPDWSPDTFLSWMYTGHLAVYRTELVKRIEGFRPEYDSSSEYDFTLRFLELTDHARVGHLSRVLYHRRERGLNSVPGSDAKQHRRIARFASGNSKSVQAALSRRGISGRTEPVKGMNRHRIVYGCLDYPPVSIIIPTKDNPGILTQCIESIRIHTRYPNYEVILVDNGSCREHREKILSLAERCGIHYHYEKMAFSFPRMCNIGAGLAKGALFLFLNDDTEVLQDDWLNRMVGQAMQDHTGAVGAKLLYPGSTRIQHDGIVNLRTGPEHILLRKDDRYLYDYGRNLLDYNCFAVTGACLLVSAEKYRAAGGMDEELRVNYSDVDLCLKLSDRGFYNVVRNDVVLFHYEAVSRAFELNPEKERRRFRSERKYLWEKHPGVSNGRDPFLISSFDDDSDEYTIQTWSVAGCLKAVKRKSAASGILSRIWNDSRLEYRIDEARFEESHTVLAGSVKLKGSVPTALGLYMTLTSEDGGQLMGGLDQPVRKDGRAGFLIRIPDHLLDRKSISYRVGFLMKSPDNLYAVHTDTHVVLPVKQEAYCEGVHIDPASAAIRGYGMILTSLDQDDSGAIRVSGYFDRNRRRPDLWNCYLAVREKTGMIYYHLWKDCQDREDRKDRQGFAGGSCGFYGRIHSTGKVQAVLYVDRETDTRYFYPITYDLLCRQLGGDTVYWNRITEDTLARQRSAVFEKMLRFSIVVPIYNTSERFLREMIASVQEQTYCNWQLCLADGSDSEHAYVGAVCEEASREDHRIVYRRLEKNGGISENTNECLKMASGDWIAFLDHDDLLAPNALYEAMLVLRQRPETELIYTDEDKVDETGTDFTDPHFKTDFDEDLLRSCNYICHFLLVKRELVARVGGLRTRYNGSQDYDFILRCTERTSAIEHIPKVLYHWRIHAQSAAESPDNKQYAYAAAQKAIADHLERSGVKGASVEQTEYPGYYHVSYPVKRKEGVSILIHVKDQGRMLKRCVDAICEKTTYPKYEILISYTGTREYSMDQVFHRIRSRHALSHPIHIFRDAELEKRARGAYLVELDPSCEIQTADWLERMLGNMQRTRFIKAKTELPGPGTVGEGAGHPASSATAYELSAVCAKVVSADGTIISCGLTDHQPGSPLSLQDFSVYTKRGEGYIDSLLKGVRDPGYDARAIMQQTVLGTDRWCYMTRRKDRTEYGKEAPYMEKGLQNSSVGAIAFCPDVIVKKRRPF